MEEVRIRDEFIKLGQAIKLAGEAGSGLDAKIMIQNGEVTVNHEAEFRRGRKLYRDDIFCYDGREFIIKN